MPDDTIPTPIQIAWINFVKSVEPLLAPHPNDRALDQYLAFRNAVLVLVRNERFLNELNGSWPPTSLSGNVPLTEIGDALLLELQATTQVLEVAQAIEKPGRPKRWWRKTLGKMLGRASTVTGSVHDLMENLPPYAKMCLTLFKQLVDLFKGKE